MITDEEKRMIRAVEKLFSFLQLEMRTFETAFIHTICSFIFVLFIHAFI